MAHVYAFINKDTLFTICEQMKVSEQYIIEKTKLGSDKVSRWLTPSDQALPTIIQAKKIASCLHIPFAALYMNPENIPLKQLPKIKNFRTLPGSSVSDDSALNIAMMGLLLERDSLAGLNADQEISTKAFTVPAPTGDSPIQWANYIRDHFNISLGVQMKSSSKRQFYLYLRNQIELCGIIIQCFTDVPLEVARGLAIYDQYTPIIGINAEDRYPAKSFTIIHELVHILRHESTLCNDMFNSFSSFQEEAFCNSVAGELLVPEQSLFIVLNDMHLDGSFSLEIITNIASRFSVSREVIIRRLLDLKKIGKVEYDTFSSEFFLEYEREKEERKKARHEGVRTIIPKYVDREAVDKTSSLICKLLYKGYLDGIYSKKSIASHLGINQKYVDGVLREVSKWSN